MAEPAMSQGASDVYDYIRRERERNNLTMEQLALRTGASTDDLEFLETYGIAVNDSMLQALKVLGIQDHRSEDFTRMAVLVSGEAGPGIVRALVRAGYRSIEQVEAADSAALQRVAGLGVRDLQLLRQGLELFRRQTMIDDADAA